MKYGSINDLHILLEKIKTWKNKIPRYMDIFPNYGSLEEDANIILTDIEGLTRKLSNIKKELSEKLKNRISELCNKVYKSEMYLEIMDIHTTMSEQDIDFELGNKPTQKGKKEKYDNNILEKTYHNTQQYLEFLESIYKESKLIVDELENKSGIYRIGKFEFETEGHYIKTIKIDGVLYSDIKGLKKKLKELKIGEYYNEILSIIYYVAKNNGIVEIDFNNQEFINERKNITGILNCKHKTLDRKLITKYISGVKHLNIICGFEIGSEYNNGHIKGEKQNKNDPILYDIKYNQKELN